MAMSTIEQIVICKLMLFSYIYHHQKVRAAEGLLIKLLQGAVGRWQDKGLTDEEILEIISFRFRCYTRWRIIP